MTEVTAYATSRGVGGRVTVIEYRTDMPNVFASCDLVVDASWAGTGITGTVREGMAMQKPVIATDCGGKPELSPSPARGRPPTNPDGPPPPPPNPGVPEPPGP